MWNGFQKLQYCIASAKKNRNSKASLLWQTGIESAYLSLQKSRKKEKVEPKNDIIEVFSSKMLH